MSQSVFVHLRERLVAEDAGVVHADVELAERVDRALHDALAGGDVGDAVVARDRLAARAP